jgi:putative hydrolase of the HAD superfamily
MKQSVKAVIFDFGGVLSQHPRAAETRRMSAACGLDPEAFIRLFQKLRPDYDRGTLSADGYWTRLLREAGRDPADGLTAWLQDLDLASWTRPRPAMVRWARRLRRGGWATAVLSNMPRELLAPIERRFRWLAEFAPRVYSCQVGWNKPEPEIFALCLSRLGLEARETLFLDDHPGNVAAARRQGLQVVEFRSPGQCARELEERFELPRLAPLPHPTRSRR